MGRSRSPLPDVPLDILSKQQRTVYHLATKYNTSEISKILSIPEKQVRQVYSAIRSKSREFANIKVPRTAGAEHALSTEYETENSSSFDCIREMVENGGLVKLTSAELFVMEQVKKGLTIRQISRLTGKSPESVKKIRQRAKRKLCQNEELFVDNCITKIDTGQTYVRLVPGKIRKAIEQANIGRHEICNRTGITPGRLREIEISGNLTYDELFKLIKQLNFNPYGPTEKEEILKKLTDVNWIKMIREGNSNHFYVSIFKAARIKAKFKNRVMYYGTSHHRYNSLDPDRPVIEEGRNGLFPLELTREQLAECDWLLKRLSVKPVFRYRHHGLTKEISILEKKLRGEADTSKADRYRRELVHLKEDIMPEDGKAIFIITKNHFFAINRALYESRDN